MEIPAMQGIIEKTDEKKWLREGTLVYILHPTGKYRKGVEELENLVTVNVGGARAFSDVQREELAEEIKNNLNLLLLLARAPKR